MVSKSQTQAKALAYITRFVGLYVSAFLLLIIYTWFT